MAITAQERTNIEKLVVAMFNAAVGSTYLADLTVAYESNGRSLAQLARTLAETSAYKALNPVFQTADEFANVFLTPYGLQANAEARAFVVAKYNAGVSKGQIAFDAAVALDAYTGTDAAITAARDIQNNKTAVSEYYSVTKNIAQTNVGSLQQVISTVTKDPATVTSTQTAIDNGSGASSGNVFTLTSGVDNVSGTSGNDTIIADNTGTALTATAGDQVNGGAGVDTLKFYVKAADALDAQTLPQLTGVETLYVKGGTATDGKTLDVSAITGLTTVELDSPLVLVDAKNFTIKTTATQTVGLDNVNTATAGTSKVTLSAGNTLFLNAVGTSTTDTGVVQVDLASGTATSASIAATGAASKVTLLNTAGKVATLTITGDQGLTLTEGLATLKTINASAATGKVSVDTAVGINGVDSTFDATFAFTGGAGADTLKLTQGSLNALTAGSQLNGGAGTDTLYIVGNTKAATDLTFAAADYKAVNAAQGFEILALASGAAKATSVDASLLTSIKEFAVFGTTNTISKIAAGTTVDINGATTKTTVSGAVGTSDLTINIGSATATTGTANTALDVTGLTNVTVNANIKAGTVGAGHNLGTLTNSDNSVFTIKGNGDLTVALAAATLTGSKIDGSASTGILTLTGNSAALDGAKASLGDILIGGSGNDVLKSGANSSSLTGNAGKDTFDAASAVAGATTPVTTVTDFSKGDILKVAASGAILEKLDLSGLAAGKTDAQVFTAIATAASTAVGDVVWAVYNGNTYVFDEVATAGAINAGDIAVKLIGSLDLSTSTIAAGVVTFA